MKRFSVFTTGLALLIAVASQVAFSETRLYIPQFRFNDAEDTQLLVANSGDRDATLDVWAFTDAGELLGQYQLPVKAHGTRALTLGDAFQLKTQSVKGWIGAVSSSDGIQVSYTSIGDRSDSFEAQVWASHDVQLTVNESRQEVVRFANPNAFATTINVSGVDSDGRGLGSETVTVGAFAQLELPAAKLLGGRARGFNVTSNADIVAGIHERTPETRMARNRHQDDVPEASDMLLVIDSTEAVGAYQVTLRFDPNLVQFGAKDILGGGAAGFDSRPLVVNIDNVSGTLTLGSFQVGARPTGRVAVARIHAASQTSAVPRFGLTVDEITNATGESLRRSGLSVGLIRAQ